MGQSGIILKEKKDIIFEEILSNVKKALENAGYHYICDTEKGCFKSFEYESNTICVQDRQNPERGYLMYLYGKSEEVYDTMFDWIKKGACLNQIISIEDFNNCEDMLLRFVYEYMKLSPNDIFYDELDWYYTKADIDKIVSNSFNKNWCDILPT